MQTIMKHEACDQRKGFALEMVNTAHGFQRIGKLMCEEIKHMRQTLNIRLQRGPSAFKDEKQRFSGVEFIRANNTQ